MVGGLRHPGLPDVVDYDGCHDGAQRRAHDPPVWSVNRRNRAAGSPHVSTAISASGYLLAWGLFSLLATVAHWLLDQSGLLSPQMSSLSRSLGGLLLVLAGIYQFTPWKHACLRHCRGPLDFVVHHWQPGRVGALAMGLRHGALCVDCVAGWLWACFSMAAS
jgi:predicted metal-binding membrane protein